MKTTEDVQSRGLGKCDAPTTGSTAQSATGCAPSFQELAAHALQSVAQSSVDIERIAYDGDLRDLPELQKAYADIRLAWKIFDRAVTVFGFKVEFLERLEGR